jgi:hypothetical protein
MKRRILLGIPAALTFSFCLPCFAQAIAESALTHALSSTATTQAGSTLGRSLNQATAATQSRISNTMNTVSGRIQSNGQRPASPTQSKLAAAPKTNFGGTMGLTIRGGQMTGARAANKSMPNVAPSKEDVQPANTPPAAK